MNPIVSVEWLVEHHHEVTICDVRWYLDGSPGRDAYEAGHIPGAVWIDLDAVLAAPPSARDGRHPLPDAATFSDGMAAAGVADDRPIVVYDDRGGMGAGRLTWMLRITGRDAALLDGGLQAWTGPLQNGTVVLAPTTFTTIPWPASAIADIDDVADPPSGTIVFDARAAERFRGDIEPLDPRAGHIPGALNAPFSGNLGSDGRFLDGDALRRRWADLGLEDDDNVIVYCGSGVSACHNLLALEAAGVAPERLRLYPGSWSQWSATDRYAATGNA